MNILDSNIQYFMNPYEHDNLNLLSGIIKIQ